MFQITYIDIEVALFFVLTGFLLFSRTCNDNGLRAAIKSMNDAFFTIDRKGRITGVNEIAEKLTGWSKKEMIGKPAAGVIRLVDHDTRAAPENPALQVLSSGKTVRLANSIMLIARDGSEHPVEASAAPMRVTGHMHGVILIFRDILERYTAEQKLLESEERLKAVTDEIRVGLVMINRDRRYVYANSFYKHILGISDKNIIGMKVGDLLPALYEQISSKLDRAFEGERFSYEIKGLNRTHQGLNRIYSVTYEPQKRQSLVMHVVIVVMDVTDMKTSGEILSAS